MTTKNINSGNTAHVLNLQDLVNGQYILNIHYADSNQVNHVLVYKLD